ncbi:hypothetical protein AAG570_006407 [Ranatra chinensis]|uniref:Uncharacterized protein n=1 Tax=Ranatra chinensis TaxID=642074 RepID=A0ABD0ZAZ2_9HEMI
MSSLGRSEDKIRLEDLQQYEEDIGGYCRKIREDRRHIDEGCVHWLNKVALGVQLHTSADHGARIEKKSEALSFMKINLRNETGPLNDRRNSDALLEFVNSLLVLDLLKPGSTACLNGPPANEAAPPEKVAPSPVPIAYRSHTPHSLPPIPCFGSTSNAPKKYGQPYVADFHTPTDEKVVRRQSTGSPVCLRREVTGGPPPLFRPVEGSVLSPSVIIPTTFLPYWESPSSTPRLSCSLSERQYFS